MKYRLNIMLVIAIALMTACAPLSKHDSILGDVGEVAGRAILCPLTLCISEMEFARQEHERTQQQRRAAWYQSLTPEQQEREDQRQHERSLAAMQALSLMQLNRPIFGGQPAPQYQMPVYQQPSALTSCSSRVVGSSIYTDCR